jgi:predicted alpha/beta-hydrolase family hydrolase
VTRSTGLILTPGASADRNQPSLIAIDKAVSALGVRVERIDLGSTRANVVIKKIAEAAGAIDDVDDLYLGGRSMGGRMCSMAVADGTVPAAGLVLVSYPLHPPGRPEQLRTDHFPQLHVPCLFVSGTRDAFATPAELEHHTAAIPGEVTHVWIEGGNHGLSRKDAAVTDAVRSWLLGLRGSGPRARGGRSRGTSPG